MSLSVAGRRARAAAGAAAAVSGGADAPSMVGVSAAEVVSVLGPLEPMRPRQSDTKVVEARVLPDLGRRL